MDGLDAGSRQPVRDEMRQCPYFVELAQLRQPYVGIARQFPDRRDDVVACGEIATAVLERLQNVLHLVAVDVEDADAALGVIDFDIRHQAPVVRIAARRIAEDILDLVRQMHGAGGGKVRAHLLADAERGKWMTDEGQRDIRRLRHRHILALPGPLRQRFRDECVADRFQPTMAESDIRLEMRTLRPFVPCIDEHQAFVAHEQVAQFVKLFLHVKLKGLGCGADETVATLRLAWRVVPAGEHAGIALLGDRRSAQVAA